MPETISLRPPSHRRPVPVYAEIGPHPKKIIVTCLWWGTLYPKEYVIRLFNSVKRNLSVPHEFVVMTDRADELPDGIRKIPLQVAGDQYTGWWQKPGMFAPDVFPKDSRVLFLDLDVIITKSLDTIASAQGDFVTLQNFGQNPPPNNSSVVLWTPSSDIERIYNCLTVQAVKELHGDQCWIWRVMKDRMKYFPIHTIDSYKYSKQPKWNRTTGETAIIVFHGVPKPHELPKSDPLLSHWR